MRAEQVFLTIFVALTLTACGGSGGGTGIGGDNELIAAPQGGIRIADTTRETLSPLPDVAFVGFGSTNNPRGSADGDSVADSAVVASSPESTMTDASVSTGSGDDRGGSGGSSADSAVDSISIPERPPVQVPPGTLTAGDYDDHLNPHLYQRYAGNYIQSAGQRIDVPRLDFSQRITIRVTDASNQAYADAKLHFLDNDGNEFLSLATPVSGETAIYTKLDSLPSQFEIRADGLNGNSVQATIDREQAYKSGIINIKIPEQGGLSEPSQISTPVEVMFVIDTTGSMGDELGYLQTELDWIIRQISSTDTNMNLGLVVYRDLGDEYVVRSYGLSNDVNQVLQTLNGETYAGGGDYPEAMDQALHQAVDANWQQDSRKVIFLIADAPPHADKMRATWNAAVQARAKNIHIAPVAASGVAEDAEYIMRSMAALTNSRYLFLTDDSGFGNSHAEPDVECYVVTHLNKLMVRVLNDLVNGTRDEPNQQDIIRKVGNYNNGVCAQ